MMKSTFPLATAAIAAGLLFAGVAPTPSQAQNQGVPAYNTVPLISPLHDTYIQQAVGSIAIGKNVNVTNENGAQSETSVAVDPTNPNHILESVNDLTTTAAVYESVDGGLTFTNANLSPSGFCYDTWLAFNTNGDAFVSYECSNQSIGYRKAGQTTWTKTTLTNAGSFPDRDMVTVDNSVSSPYFGSVYIGYDDNGNNNTPYVIYSRDGFSNWVRSAAIPHTNPTIGVNVTTGPDGTVYAAWEDYTGKKLYISSSNDGGATFGTAVVVTSFRLNTSTFFVSIPPQNIRGILPFPMTATDIAGSHAGRVYVSYTDKDPSTSNTNIYVRYSDDHAATWSNEVKVNDDTTNAYHFHHQIAVNPRGLVGVSFYDTRRDPANKKTDRYVAISNNGATSFAPNKRITSKQSDETVSGVDGNQYGDYQGIYAAPNGSFRCSWTDSRNPGAIKEDMFAGGIVF